MGFRLDTANKRIEELQFAIKREIEAYRAEEKENERLRARVNTLEAEAGQSNKLYYEAMEQINVLDGEIDVLKRELVAARARSKSMPCPKKKAAKTSKAAKKRK